MRRQGFCAILLAASAIGTAATYADMPPPPGTVERFAAATIQRAGYDCPSVESLTSATGPEGDALVWGTSRPDIATCSNGKKYLVAMAPRTGPPGRPGNPPVPPPPKILVKPL